MKKIISLFLLLFAFCGCVTTPEIVKTGLPLVNVEHTTNIGDRFFEYTETIMQPLTPPFRRFEFELIVVEANSNKISLFYSEYTGEGLIKEGFNKRFDYSGNDKIIRFKEYEFEIISINNGQIKYKRIK